MAFRSVNLNAQQPTGPQRGGGGGGNYRGGGGGGYNAQPAVRIDASGRVDQGFGPVGGAAALNELEFDIFGVDDPATFQTLQQLPVAPQQNTLYAIPAQFAPFVVPAFLGLASRSLDSLSLHNSVIAFDLETPPNPSLFLLFTPS